uniref:Cationic amino acid transporter C-terminal domain-containing protein n=1 Tax=Auxenochlorella protothecoides TaxID=3075 RepID=A0A1D2A014_AUXPR
MNWKEFLQDYWAGVKKIPQIFQRIGFRKRTLEDELNEALLRGNLRKVFSGFDLLMLGLGITIGGGVWRLTGHAASSLAGPSIIVSYLLAGMACTFAAACYGELVVEYPVAGGAFTYIMVSFGEFPAWMTVSNQVTEYLFGMAVVARSFSGYLANLCGADSTLFTLGGSRVPGAWSVDLMALAVILAVTALLCVSGHSGSKFISCATVLKLGFIVLILIVGFTKADPANLSPFLLDDSVNGIFTAAAVFMYAMTGFDSVSNAAEEAKDIGSLPWAMVGTTLIATVVYMLLALMLCLLQPYTQINRLDGFTNAFVYVGLDYMQYIVATAAVLGCITGLMVGLYAISRLVMVVARDWMLPPFLARVSTRTQTPLVAQIVLGLIIGTIALLVPADFLGDLVSFGQLFSMWSVVNAQVFRRYYPEIKLRFTRFGAVETANAKVESMALGGRLNLSVAARRRLVALHMALMTLFATGLATWYTVMERNKQHNMEVIGCSVFAALFFLVTLSMKLLCPIQYEPQRFHIPSFLMPWLPAGAIGLILFGMASISPSGYYKIGAYNLLVFLFYFLFSLPMSYIKHYKLDFVNTEQMNIVDLVYDHGQWMPSKESTARLGAGAGSYLAAELSEGSYTNRPWSRHASTILKSSSNPSGRGARFLDGAAWGPSAGSSRALIGGLSTSSVPDVLEPTAGSAAATVASRILPAMAREGSGVPSSPTGTVPTIAEDEPLELAAPAAAAPGTGAGPVQITYHPIDE